MSYYLNIFSPYNKELRLPDASIELRKGTEENTYELLLKTTKEDNLLRGALENLFSRDFDNTLGIPPNFYKAKAKTPEAFMLSTSYLIQLGFQVVLVTTDQ